jgi:hypothetical protein
MLNRFRFSGKFSGFAVNECVASPTVPAPRRDICGKLQNRTIANIALARFEFYA